MSFLRRTGGRYAAVSTRKPLARTEDLVIENVEDELLVYDGKHARAHSLSAPAARVWRACDGETSIDDLAAALELPRETVVNALDELEGAELLESYGLQIVNGGSANGNGITRRQMAVRSAKIGGAVAAAPLLYSIAVPSPAAAVTPTNLACALFSSDSCGTGSGGAGSVAGCCCCCQGPGACKVGGGVNTCKGSPCPGGGTGSCSNSCSGAGCNNVTSAGCCGVAATTDCGCAFAGGDSTQLGCVCNSTGGQCNSNSQVGCVLPCISGAVNCGAGCCSPTSATCQHVPDGSGGHFLINCGGCTPGATNCVPCCNGSPVNQSTTGPDPVVAFTCCKPGPTTTCGRQSFPGP
jgi:hypothetical protein